MFLFFDTETTGLPGDWNAPVENTENWPRLVQIAWLLYDYNERKIEEKEYIIKPEGFLIPQEAASVHKITTERALSEGRMLRDVLGEFAAAAANADFLVAHNMSFDEKIAGAEFLRCSMENNFFRKERVCTMISSVDFCKIASRNGEGYKWPRLSELHIALFGEDFKNAHDAFTDARACAKCFFELKKRKVIDLPAVKQIEAGAKKQGSLFLFFIIMRVF